MPKWAADFYIFGWPSSLAEPGSRQAAASRSDRAVNMVSLR
jgi:hypothetical protein